MADNVATHGTTTQQGGIPNLASGVFTTDAGDAVAVAVTTGFKPRYVKIFDETNGTTYEKTDGMTSANVMKVLPGTTGASDTVTQASVNGSLIVLGDRGFTVAAGAAVASSKFAWVAFG